jgi:hypothetical protein
MLECALARCGCRGSSVLGEEMPLLFKPFSACAQLVAVAKGSPTLHEGHHGSGVRLVQGALLDLGYPLVRSTKKSHRSRQTTALARRARD